MKKAFITGITGQDGAYLAKFLLGKGYHVHGMKRRTSAFNTSRIDDIFEKYEVNDKKFHLHFGDVTDYGNIFDLISKIMPDEVYNLAAQSHVAVSFELPEYTANVGAMGTLRILEALRNLKSKKKIKFYQASTSELFGNSIQIPQNEETPFYPRSPYAVSKLFSYWITKNYREAYGMHLSNGILFNHESPLRGETFVTRKITRGLTRIKLGLEKNLKLGNIYSKRDWGHAEDFIEAQWMILQQKKPDDYVIATGIQYSVKDFINLVAKKLSLKIKWKGKGLKEVCINKDNNKVIISIDKKYFRPSETNSLVGDYKKARKILGWRPKKNINNLIDDMLKEEKLTK
jgi:GDPmannose 4,6-dehydratase